MSSASRGLAPREGLELLLLKLGRTEPLMEPHHGPQAGKSGYPRSQDADNTSPQPRVDYSLLIMVAAGMMKMATDDDFPLQQGAKIGSDWFLVAIEACGGGTPDLGFFSGVSVFIGIFGVENKSGGPRGDDKDEGRAHPCGGLVALLAQHFCFGASSGPQKVTVNFQLIWTPFDIPFL